MNPITENSNTPPMNSGEGRAGTCREHNLSAPIHASIHSFLPKRTPQQVLQDLLPLVQGLSTNGLPKDASLALDALLSEASELTSAANQYEDSPYFEPEAEHSDVLPRVGQTVLIHLARQNEWVPHQVVGFYAWPSHGGEYSLSRLFVRVRDANGLLNARLLHDVLRLDKTPFLA